MIKWIVYKPEYYRRKWNVPDVYNKKYQSEKIIKRMDIMAMKEGEEERSRRESKMNPVDTRWFSEKWMGFGTYEDYLNGLEDMN